MQMMTPHEDDQALVSLTGALPELRADHYADVLEWDACRLRLAEGYERADGEFLAKIQAKLAPAGLWGGYLKARSLPYQTAQDRIRRAQGTHISNRRATETVTPRLLDSGTEPGESAGPEEEPTPVPALDAAPAASSTDAEPAPHERKRRKGRAARADGQPSEQGAQAPSEDTPAAPEGVGKTGREKSHHKRAQRKPTAPVEIPADDTDLTVGVSIDEYRHYARLKQFVRDVGHPAVGSLMHYEAALEDEDDDYDADDDDGEDQEDGDEDAPPTSPVTATDSDKVERLLQQPADRLQAALPMLRLLAAVDACHQVTSESVRAWLEVVAPAEWEAGDALLVRLTEWIALVRPRIRQRQRAAMAQEERAHTAALSFDESVRRARAAGEPGPVPGQSSWARPLAPAWGSPGARHSSHGHT